MNSHVSAATRKTPFEVLFGYEPYSPLSLRLGIEPRQNIGDQDRAEIRRFVEEHLTMAQERMKKQANKKRIDHQFKVGDLVKLRTDGLKFKGIPKKFKQPFIGPFPVEKVMGPLVYRLTLPADLLIHPVFHISQLQGFHQRPVATPEDPDNPATLTEEQAATAPTRPGPVIEEEGDEEDTLYEVEAILEQRLLRGKQGDSNEDYEYRLKWTGWGRDDRWYPFSNLVHCPEVITAWRTTVPLREPKKARYLKKISEPQTPKSNSNVKTQTTAESTAKAPQTTPSTPPTTAMHAMTTRSKAKAVGTPPS
jgi:hypothetical protein